MIFFSSVIVFIALVVSFQGHAEAVRVDNPLAESDPDIYQGDMILDEEQKNYFRQLTKFEAFPERKWPEVLLRGGIRTGRYRVRYIIDESYSGEDRSIIRNAINDWNNRVGKCVEWQNIPGKISNKTTYVEIKSVKGRSSRIGKMEGSGAQVLSLVTNCLSRASILHEMMHAVGFIHEQNRYDRNDSIRVLWDNIPSGFKGEFEVPPNGQYDDYGPFDFYSVMMYAIYAFGKDKPAYEVLVPGIDLEQTGEGRLSDHSLTDLDVAGIIHLYGCTNV
uniref:Metalloendopeptidase n=1 Tax=Scytodes thoracica TaxID=1112478 RepID=A0A0A0V5P2_SCYTH|nr:astacin-like protein [Scytodes thoracica]